MTVKRTHPLLIWGMGLTFGFAPIVERYLATRVGPPIVATVMVALAIAVVARLVIGYVDGAAARLPDRFFPTRRFAWLAWSGGAFAILVIVRHLPPLFPH